METYNAKSCSALEKPFYRPIEAALRWCNLTAHEVDILQITGASLLPPAHAFPHWPCLRANAEKIIDAIQNSELQKGREGRTVAPGETVAKEKMTVRHTDLKAWMAKHYPDQKPKFLFDEIERNTHATYNAETFQALQAERDAAKATIEVARQWAEKKVEELNFVRAERDALAAQVKETDPLDTRERNSLLSIIAALCKEAKIDYTKPAKAAGLIQSTAALMQVSIGETTIEGHLKKIPDALATRMK
jgi:hypothetical protein